MNIGTYSDLRKLSDADLIEKFSDISVTTEVGLSFIREELARREVHLLQRWVLCLTGIITILTVVITVLTAVNVYYLVFAEG